MKKMIKWGAVSVVLLALTILRAAAQEQQTVTERYMTPKFGFKGGLNLSNMYVKDVADENMKVGWNAGLYAKLPMGRGFSIQPELYYTDKGAKETYNNFVQGKGEYRYNLNYVELPLLAVFNLGNNFNIHAGPYISYLVSANIKDLKSDGTIHNIVDLNAEDFHRLDWGAQAGLGVDIENFTIGARYAYGFHHIGKSDNTTGSLLQDSKNSVISLYIGFGF